MKTFKALTEMSGLFLYICTMKWLTMLFGSVRAAGDAKQLLSQKGREHSQGKINIKEETSKGAAVSGSSEILLFSTNLLLWSQIIQSLPMLFLLGILYWLLLIPKTRFS